MYHGVREKDVTLAVSLCVTAHFSLPADDPKVVECQPLRFVEIFDGNERVDLFRVPRI